MYIYNMARQEKVLKKKTFIPQKGSIYTEVADNSFYRPAKAILTVTDQNDSRHNVKTVLPIINTLILLENDQQLLSQS